MHQKLKRDNFINGQTATLKIPVSLPYQLHPRGYKKAEGTFEYNGQFFNIIKQKIENDTLYVVYIENQDKSALSRSMTNYERAVNNWPQSSGKAYQLLNTFIKDYNTCSTTNIVGSLGWCISNPYFSNDFSPLTAEIRPGNPPPEA